MPEKEQSLAAPDKGPAPEAKKEAAPAEKAPEKDEKGFDPNAEHPRFKEVYWKMKKHERALEDREKDLEAVRSHNAQITARLEELERGSKVKHEEPEPDPAADPDGYKAWHRLQLQKKEKEFEERQERGRMANLIEIEAGLHEDYPQAIAVAEREMGRDAELKKKIWADPNPVRAAYKLGRKKMDEVAARDKEEQERQERLDAGATEGAGGGDPKPGKEEDLSDDEKRVIRNIFRDMPFADAAKKYKEQKKLLAGRG